MPPSPRRIDQPPGNLLPEVLLVGEPIQAPAELLIGLIHLDKQQLDPGHGSGAPNRRYRENGAS
ncbi:MAG: hypothetical protein M3R66_07510, partial [Actinomycetota bacterium]|nr:hypothetical protein [Actinomycetota bacterium]